MSVYHVPIEEWPSFIERFTEQHRGEPLTVRHRSGDGEDVSRGCFDRLVLDTGHGDPRLWAFFTETVGVSRPRVTSSSSSPHWTPAESFASRARTASTSI